MPPYVLSQSTKYLKSEPHNTMTDVKTALTLKENDVNVLFCCYCLSADDQWLIATCTDQIGELTETALIKITYPIWYATTMLLFFFFL